MKITVVLVLAGALLLALTFRWLPDRNQQQPADAGVSAAELAQLKSQFAELDRQHKATSARLAELEDFFASGALGGTQLLELEVDEILAVDADPPAQLQRPGMRGIESRAQKIQEAGMTVDEFAAIEEQAYSLYLEGLETDWTQRRDRYRKTDREPNSTERLRENLGEDAYDRYLYASGRTNRVQLRRVLPGSAAEQAGLTKSDVVLSYDDQRVFNFEDLRRLSYEGDIGDQVLLEVRRSDGSVSQVIMPRGPLGVSGGGSRGVPDG